MKKTYYRPETEIESIILENNFLGLIIGGSDPDEEWPGSGGGGSGGAGDVNLHISFDEDEEVEPKWDAL